MTLWCTCETPWLWCSSRKSWVRRINVTKSKSEPCGIGKEGQGVLTVKQGHCAKSLGRSFLVLRVTFLSSVPPSPSGCLAGGLLFGSITLPGLSFLHSICIGGNRRCLSMSATMFAFSRNHRNLTEAHMHHSLKNRTRYSATMQVSAGRPSAGIHDKYMT